MNHAKKTITSLFLGLTVLLATLATTISPASAGIPSGALVLSNFLSEHEIEALLSEYDMADEMELNNVTVKIYDINDELVYSAEVCQRDFECDDRINHMINQSDFITDIDNTRIYYLDQ